MKENKIIEMRNKVETLGGGGSEDAGRTRKHKRPLSWDARDIKTYSGLSGSTGRFTERFFEQEEN